MAEGERLIYTPAALRDGQVLELVVLPAQAHADRSFAEWFAETVSGVQGELGKPLKPDFRILVDESGRLRADNAVVDAEDGGRLMVNYRGSELDDGHFLLSYLLSNSAGATDQRVVTDLPRVMAEAEVLRREEAAEAIEARERAVRQAARDEEIAHEKRLAAIRTAPGQGVQAERIETFWVNAELDVFFGGLDVTISALLRDGTIYRGVWFPPSELDVDVSRRLFPEQWSTWRESGDGYEYAWQDETDGTSGWRTLDGWRAMRAGPDEAIDGVFEYSGGSQRSGAFTHSLRLGADGRFEHSSFSLTSTADSISPDVTPTIHRATTRDGNGTEVVTGVTTGPVVGSTGGSAGDGAGNVGSYRIDGDVMERRYDDGTTSRDLFLWAQEDKSSVIVGDTFYYLP